MWIILYTCFRLMKAFYASRMWRTLCAYGRLMKSFYNYIGWEHFYLKRSWLYLPMVLIPMSKSVLPMDWARGWYIVWVLLGSSLYVITVGALVKSKVQCETEGRLKQLGESFFLFIGWNLNKRRRILMTAPMMAVMFVRLFFQLDHLLWWFVGINVFLNFVYIPVVGAIVRNESRGQYIDRACRMVTCAFRESR